MNADAEKERRETAEGAESRRKDGGRGVEGKVEGDEAPPWVGWMWNVRGAGLYYFMVSSTE
jgi:hypothetical protein